MGWRSKKRVRTNLRQWLTQGLNEKVIDGQNKASTIRLIVFALSAIAMGARKPADIALQADLPQRSSVDPYLAQLVEMDYVRRELPATVPPKKRHTSRLSRYVLADNYLRFYFRFVRSNLDLIAQQLTSNAGMIPLPFAGRL